MEVAWDLIFASEWFLPTAGQCLSLSELSRLSLASKSCQDGVRMFTKGWPDDIKLLLQNWCKEMPSKLLVFGVHEANKLSRFNSCFPLHSNPAPIIQFSFDALAYDSTKNELVGNGWSELAAMSSPLHSLGRLWPIVCPVDETGSKIFCCGGRFYTDQREEKWLKHGDFVHGLSRLTAMFDVEKASWEELPPMPEARCDARVVRIGSMIFVIGGALAASRPANIIYAKSILGFDINKKQWFNPGFDDFPGDAVRHFAVVAQNEKILVVGGEGDRGLLPSSREVFSLTP